MPSSLENLQLDLEKDNNLIVMLREKIEARHVSPHVAKRTKLTLKGTNNGNNMTPQCNGIVQLHFNNQHT